ncbi:hypothetical protein LZ32DRAFT_142422 [Colletotrichum eremochloae]|nr:hypothetical protein LZ32DRAFT_142422 [Colletotrichum eremochloae]
MDDDDDGGGGGVPGGSAALVPPDARCQFRGRGVAIVLPWRLRRLCAMTSRHGGGGGGGRWVVRGGCVAVMAVMGCVCVWREKMMYVGGTLLRP